MSLIQDYAQLCMPNWCSAKCEPRCHRLTAVETGALMAPLKTAGFAFVQGARLNNLLSGGKVGSGARPQFHACTPPGGVSSPGCIAGHRQPRMQA